MLAVKKIINLYFYIGCKWRWDTNDTSAGALFFFIPSFFIVAIVDHIYNKLLCHHMPVLLMNIIAWSLVLLVYIFYKYNDRGVKIIAYYNEYTQIRKWYINTIIGIAYFCAFCLITYCSFKIIDCILWHISATGRTGRWSLTKSWLRLSVPTAPPPSSSVSVRANH